ncbi:hypothetical protein Nepgr_030727 [Nepenthes gracilis]|uniref:MINDY deubiquitinase domain-containing protein n=1 Tax=Nepenthes gracilis TaxID=150966 RepID=A0AAD3TGR5_NEPGR|nr:hypothetical protein Nepgr_030727 [Nepenthes gracilis]
MASSEEQRREEQARECVHKTKTVQFFGRTTPIVLQNDNGPCPLLAICNVLLLRNQLKLSPDISEVSQEKLLSLVADQLIESNSNVNNKDAGYVENQQQNIADAIDLLPQLLTGIDVNVKFRRIHDFEFTPECAIFDLLDIPLYHGWLVDPQDCETAKAIGSKSYNTLMGELVTLETQKMEEKFKDKSDEDCIDFAAATTAALGVPSPCLSRAKSFDDSPCSHPELQKIRKGDAQEAAELLRVMKLSETESSEKEDDSVIPGRREEVVSINSDEDISQMKFVPSKSVAVSEEHNSGETLHLEPSISGDRGTHSNSDDTEKLHARVPEKADVLSSKVAEASHIDQKVSVPPGEDSLFDNLACQHISHTVVQDEISTCSSPEKSTSVHCQGTQTQFIASADLHEEMLKHSWPENSTLIVQNADTDSSNGTSHNIEATETFTSSLDGNEPLYEGEECILDSGATSSQDREPVYEGEAVLAEQADKGTKCIFDGSSKDEITPQQGELIGNFLKNNASQLTFYGLFCLQEGLKERELCVFFRNNHFSTMFKFDKELYLLATDQGYINQPDLVWEKLNEVNGDTLFMTSNFKEFKLGTHDNGSWDEQNAVASTADYLASIDNSEQGGSNINSDLQLAIALQQQEFEQQPPRHAPQQPLTGSSRLITGPQVPRTSGKTSSSPKPDRKSKECTIM